MLKVATQFSRESLTAPGFEVFFFFNFESQNSNTENSSLAPQIRDVRKDRGNFREKFWPPTGDRRHIRFLDPSTQILYAIHKDSSVTVAIVLSCSTVN
ncbi:hypothetical protein U1Q18_005144 [Sarracenia purpurea var. burkii]